MEVKLYNTLSRTIETFAPLNPPTVTMYHCGPTVYWTQHIGNLRGMTMGDLVVRTLRYFGYDVKHARNYTDVGHLTGDNIGDADTGEDRMEKGAKRENKTPKEIADKYIGVFERDVQAINLVEPTYKPRATEYIPQMVAMVSELLANGYAYATDLAVYFDVRKFKNYTQLSRQNMDDLAAGAGRAETSDPQKKYPADFALWFFKAGTHANALQYWDSPFSSPLVENGQGFPGWHIECSAMSRALLGKTLDIHMGGIEHISIHHTNEIAQSEAANNAPFVRYWLHNEWLVVNSEKMAKSQGTGFSLQEIIDKGFDPLALRYLYLTAHYRSKQNFTWEALEDARNSLNNLKNKVAGWTAQASQSDKTNAWEEKFKQALANDINVPQALATAWDVAKSSELSDAEKRFLLLQFDAVLGLKLSEATQQTYALQDLPDDIRTMVADREAARAQKDFAKADQLRTDIDAAGFIVEDTAQGIRIQKKTA